MCYLKEGLRAVTSGHFYSVFSLKPGTETLYGLFISALAPTADVTILYQTVESEAFLYELVTAEKRQEMRGEKDDNMKRRSPVRREPAVHGGCVGGGVLLYWWDSIIQSQKSSWSTRLMRLKAYQSPKQFVMFRQDFTTQTNNNSIFLSWKSHGTDILCSRYKVFHQERAFACMQLANTVPCRMMSHFCRSWAWVVCVGTSTVLPDWKLCIIILLIPVSNGNWRSTWVFFLLLAWG